MTADSVWSLGDFLPEFSAHDISRSARSAIVIAFPTEKFEKLLPTQSQEKSEPAKVDAPEAQPAWEPTSWEPEVPESYGQDVIGWGELRGLLSDLRAEVTVI